MKDKGEDLRREAPKAGGWRAVLNYNGTDETGLLLSERDANEALEINTCYRVMNQLIRWGVCARICRPLSDQDTENISFKLRQTTPHFTTYRARQSVVCQTRVAVRSSATH